MMPIALLAGIAAIVVAVLGLVEAIDGLTAALVGVIILGAVPVVYALFEAGDGAAPARSVWTRWR